MTLDAFFYPKQVVVIGASNTMFNLGATICNILKHVQYNADVYAVNRKGEDVGGCKGYVSVLDIPGPIDLAVLITPAAVVPKFVKECGEKGIQHIVIESSGFSESGGEWLRLQQEVDTYAQQYGIRYLGPNCLGVLNTDNKFICFYGALPGVTMFSSFLNIPTGEVSYVIQSGGIGVLVLDAFRTDVSKVFKMVSIGNKADIDESDLLEYFNSDNTKVIGMYLENIQNGRKFFETAQKVQKPILVFKVGRTAAGAKAATSHTAGMANNDTIFEHACKQAGILRLQSIRELHSLPKMFTHMPPLRGKRIAMITNSGAFGGITADLLVENGLEMASISKATQEKLKQTGTLYNTANPVDLGPALSLQAFLDIYDILLSSDEIDGLLPVPNVWQEIVIEGIVELIDLCKKYQKPAAIYIPNAVDRILTIRTKYQIPVFESLEEAARALAVSHQQYQFLMKKSQ
jgi:acyl-CoA synthetase (NDP forming)